MPKHAPLFDDIMAAARPALADVVVNASLRGFPMDRLAIVVERRFDGTVSLHVGERTAFLTVATGGRVMPAHRQAIANGLLTEGCDVPVVVLVEMEGYVAGGLRRLPIAVPS